MPARGRRLAIVTLLLCSAYATGIVRRTPALARRTRTRGRSSWNRAGTHPAALSLLWEAAGLAPRDADIQNRLGEALDRMGALDAAVDAYRRAVSERPDFRKAVNNLVLTLVKSGKGPEAVERARALPGPGAGRCESPLHAGAGAVGAGYRPGDRQLSAARWSSTRVTRWRATTSRSSSSARTGCRKRSRRCSARIEIEPRAEAYYTLGVIYWQQGDLDRAASALGAAVAAEPRVRRCALHARRRPGGAARLGGRRRVACGAPSRCGRICRARTTRSRECCSGRATKRAAARSSPKRSACAGGPSSSRRPACRRPLGTQKLETGDLDRRPRSIPARDGGIRGVRARALPDGPGAPAARPARRRRARRSPGRPSSTPASFHPAIRRAPNKPLTSSFVVISVFALVTGARRLYNRKVANYREAASWGTFPSRAWGSRSPQRSHSVCVVSRTSEDTK